ncbi:helix-turn-helix DNA binding protein [Mycobacterium phage ZenTime222]|uniref:Helix-turn-helix DNA binding protein n=2 Tax=Bernalvirus bernal13 TaxID=1982102 RepID=A0A482J843_9CAUD|nr:helix-turn-helix DNA binding protein [Mycobacterium phage RonRayGun]ASJ79129.1 helix-turn-helix DNA binding protein [Mycobacterium phage ZenTime222]QBP28894.1 helix-turn-helix DNA binding protein [Mycobacterium phage Ibrahim]
MTLTAVTATPETISAVTQCLKLASILDDRVGGPDAARVLAWSEQIQRHKLSEDDLLAGLQDFYDQPNDRPLGVGDLIAAARAHRRTRAASEPAERFETRGDALSEPVEITAVAAPALTTAMGSVGRTTERLERAREALQTCYGHQACSRAIREYQAARAEALGATEEAARQ